MTLTTKNGLSCDAVHWIVEDNAISWVNTACGLLRIDRAKLHAWASDPTILDPPDRV